MRRKPKLILNVCQNNGGLLQQAHGIDLLVLFMVLMVFGLIIKYLITDKELSVKYENDLFKILDHGIILW